MVGSSGQPTVVDICGPSGSLLCWCLNVCCGLVRDSLHVDDVTGQAACASCCVERFCCVASGVGSSGTAYSRRLRAKRVTSSVVLEHLLRYSPDIAQSATSAGRSARPLCCGFSEKKKLLPVARRVHARRDAAPTSLSRAALRLHRQGLHLATAHWKLARVILCCDYCSDRSSRFIGVSH